MIKILTLMTMWLTLMAAPATAAGPVAVYVEDAQVTYYISGGMEDHPMVRGAAVDVVIAGTSRGPNGHLVEGEVTLTIPDPCWGAGPCARVTETRVDPFRTGTSVDGGFDADAFFDLGDQQGCQTVTIGVRVKRAGWRGPAAEASSPFEVCLRS